MRQIYLNNKDLLREIHLSKITYCSYLNKEQDNQFDAIVRDVRFDPKPFWAKLDDLRDIQNNRRRVRPEIVAQAKQNRVDRINKLNGKEATLISTNDIPDTDVVFRVITFEHVPMAPPKVSKSKIKTKVLIEEIEPEEIDELDMLPENMVVIDPLHVKVNFPPFYHYRVSEKRELILVAKSHWIGDLDTGHFSKDHGAMTRELAKMFMKLCERYGTRSNWRNYTYNDEMRSQALLQLSQIGLQFDECKSQNPFAYYTAAITNSFTRILNIEKRNQNIRDDILEMNNLSPSYSRQMDWGGQGGGGGASPDD